MYTTWYLGYMLGNLPLEKSGIISKEHVCEGETLLFTRDAELSVLQ